MIVYKVTNKISGNVYIGQTIKSLEDRKQQHIKSIETGKTHFYNTLRSYGEDNFLWEVIDTAKSKKELNKKEIHWINEYDSKNNGYNMVDGGTGGYNEEAVKANRKKKGKKWEDIYTPEGLLVMQEVSKQLGIKLGEISKNRTAEEKIRIARMGADALNNSDYQHTEETKKKISDAQIGITYEERYGKINSEKVKKNVSEGTKKAMAKLDWDNLMEKALKGRKNYWDRKHEEQRKEIVRLKSEGFKVKEIIAKLNVSYPTYYKRLSEIQ